MGVGAPCNVCESADKRVASILRMRADGSGMEVYAQGVRNSVGFDWRPNSQEMWFTDNGRDGMGNDIPPDELNYAPRAGMNFGFPYCHGKRYFGSAVWARTLVRGVCAAGVEFAGACGGGRNAFLCGGDVSGGIPATGIFIAEHGSWDRSVPTGYRVSRVELNDQQAVEIRAVRRRVADGTDALGAAGGCAGNAGRGFVGFG